MCVCSVCVSVWVVSRSLSLSVCICVCLLACVHTCMCGGDNLKWITIEINQTILCPLGETGHRKRRS